MKDVQWPSDSEAENKNVRHYRQRVARSQPRQERQYARLRHHQSAYLPFQYGEPKRRLYQRGHLTTRPPVQTQQDSHPTNDRAGRGGE